MTQPFKAEDLFLYKSITDVHACPDASLVSCCVVSIDESNETALSKLWNVPLNGGDPYSMRTDQVPLHDTARDLSPWRHVGTAKTPTLILQGKDDERRPRGQAESFFVALKRGSRPPCELVMYPGACHNLLTQAKPSIRTDALKRIDEWLQRWTD